MWHDAAVATRPRRARAEAGARVARPHRASSAFRRLLPNSGTRSAPLAEHKPAQAQLKNTYFAKAVTARTRATSSARAVAPMASIIAVPKNPSPMHAIIIGATPSLDRAWRSVPLAATSGHGAEPLAGVA